MRILVLWTSALCLTFACGSVDLTGEDPDSGDGDRDPKVASSENAECEPSTKDAKSALSGDYSLDRPDCNLEETSDTNPGSPESSTSQENLENTEVDAAGPWNWVLACGSQSSNCGYDVCSEDRKTCYYCKPTESTSDVESQAKRPDPDFNPVMTEKFDCTRKTAQATPVEEAKLCSYGWLKNNQGICYEVIAQCGDDIAAASESKVECERNE